MKPFKFKPLLKQTLWGGDKIIAFKQLDEQLPNVGESWEISGVAGNETIVSEGAFAGKTLNALVSELKDKLVGKECYQLFGDEFPCLSSSSTHTKTCPSRFIPPMRLPISKAKNVGKPRCGI